MYLDDPESYASWGLDSWWDVGGRYNRAGKVLGERPDELQSY